MRYPKKITILKNVKISSGQVKPKQNKVSNNEILGISTPSLDLDNK